MSTTVSETPSKSRRAEKAKASHKSKSAPAGTKQPKHSEVQREARLTKHERLLTLLSQAEGASIEDMMQATQWQQHSVRGFLAGTVKRKLGFPLTSSKSSDGVRRYRIEARRGR